MPRKKQYEVSDVVDKAMHTFWRNGYEGTSVRMLEKEMGINQFSIYSSFGNKKDLFLEVLKQYKEHVETTFLKRLLTSKGSLQDIQLFLQDFGHAVRSGKNPNGCLMVNTGMEISKNNKEVSLQLTNYFKFIKNTFLNVLDKAKIRKELPKEFDSNKHAEFLLGSLQGLALYAKFRSKKEVDDFINSIMKTIT